MEKRQFNDKKFNIVEVEKRSCKKVQSNVRRKESKNRI